MRLAIGATLLAAACVRADDASSSSEAETSTTTVAKPTFTVSIAPDTKINVL